MEERNRTNDSMESDDETSSVVSSKRPDIVPPLLLSHSLIEDVIEESSKNSQPSLASSHESYPLKENNFQNDQWMDNSRTTESMFPAIRRSSMSSGSVEEVQFKHRRDKNMGKAKAKQWEVHPKANWRENTVDKKTIYNKAQDDLLEIITDDNKILPPLDSSPRMAAIVPDSRDLHEKLMVMKHYFSIGAKGHFQVDQVILPTVYTDFFDCPERKKKYINSLWLEHFRNKRKKNPCWRYDNVTNTKKSTCTYCDVMGSNYCSFCREFKNRHFALSYEANYLPDIGGLRNSKGGVNPSKKVIQLDHRGFDRKGKPRTKKKAGDKQANEKGRQMNLPLTIFPNDGDAPPVR